MRKAPVDLKIGDHLVVMSKSLVRIVDSVRPDGEAPLGARIIRTEYVKPFANCEDIPLDGTAMLDVWEGDAT